jgi:hypothetical protein
MIHSFTVTFGAKHLTGMMVTSVPPYETFSLIKNNILHQSLGQLVTKYQISAINSCREKYY